MALADSAHPRRTAAGALLPSIYDKAGHFTRREVMGEEANQAFLEEACHRAGVIVAGRVRRADPQVARCRESEICAVVAEFITRAHAAGQDAVGAVAPIVGPDCQAGRYGICPGRLGQGRDRQHELSGIHDRGPGHRDGYGAVCASRGTRYWALGLPRPVTRSQPGPAL